MGGSSRGLGTRREGDEVVHMGPGGLSYQPFILLRGCKTRVLIVSGFVF